MNLYRLFTSLGAQFWVYANCSDRAIAKVQSVSGQHVSCWFVGNALPKNVTPLTA